MKRHNIWQLIGLTFFGSLVAAAPNLEGRIVGGYETNIEDIPFQVSLQKPHHFCGGSLIRKRYVLTAAHCTDGKPPIKPGFKVRLGSKYSDKGGLLVEVIQIFQHKEYNPDNVRYDFSILKLRDYDDSSLPFKIRYARLPAVNDVDDRTVMTVSGWGYTHNSTQARDVLRAVKVVKINENLCKQIYSNFNQITDEMICAGRLEGGKDACQGDSGGPLFTNNVVWGIVSWGYGCARPYFPGVYSRVASVLKWIKSTIDE